MSDDRISTGPTAAKLEAVLLEAKLAVPRRRPGSVSRAGLIEMARGGESRVVGITAPAGYGKSTLLAQWADAEDRRIGWVSLDRLDDNPSALLTRRQTSLPRHSPWPRSPAMSTPSFSAMPSSRCWRWIAGDGMRRPTT